jgi:hypothetical protein
VAVRTPKVASVRATPGEGVAPRSARGPEAEADVAQARRARRDIDRPKLFHHASAWTCITPKF